MPQTVDLPNQVKSRHTTSDDWELSQHEEPSCIWKYSACVLIMLNSDKQVAVEY